MAKKKRKSIKSRETPTTGPAFEWLLGEGAAQNIRELRAAMTKPKRGDMVIVEWVDSANHSVGWTEVDDLKKSLQLAKIETIGYVVKYSRKGITVVQSVCVGGPGETTVCNGMSIPAGCIKQITVLK